MHSLHPYFNQIKRVVKWQTSYLSERSAHKGHQKGLHRCKWYFVGICVHRFLFCITWFLQCVTGELFAFKLHKKEDHAWIEVPMYDKLVPSHIFFVEYSSVHRYRFGLLLVIERLLWLNNFWLHIYWIEEVRPKLNCYSRCCTSKYIFSDLRFNLRSFSVRWDNKSWE